MNCEEARKLLLAKRRGDLAPASRSALDQHLADCSLCRHQERADLALSAALDRLPAHAAPASLTRALHEKWAASAERAPRSPHAIGERRFGQPAGRLRSVVRAVTAAMVGAAACSAAFLTVRALPSPEKMVNEAVNDHLRLLYAEHPIEVESGGVHQVKPWFAGRLDFAPVLCFGGDDDFPLLGGAVAYFSDRKAAAFQFKRRLHPVTLFVFRAEGLPWYSTPHWANDPRRQTNRGFHVVLWREGDLGYALVSDVAEADLGLLHQKLTCERK